MRRTVQGFSLAEVLIALAVIGVAFGALALTQVTNLRASVTARAATDVKAAANVVLESVMAQVLETSKDEDGDFIFSFNDFYWSCPTAVTPSSGSLPVVDDARTCMDTQPVGDIDVEFRIAGESGILGEGVLTITVTATQPTSGQTLTIGDRVTCYDIYPSPKSTAPAPCPTPTVAGGGRP
jgi:prepilin-type N-terminal cleavage/methylation domain-containing protein